MKVDPKDKARLIRRDSALKPDLQAILQKLFTYELQMAFVENMHLILTCDLDGSGESISTHALNDLMMNNMFTVIGVDKVDRPREDSAWHKFRQHFHEALDLDSKFDPFFGVKATPKVFGCPRLDYRLAAMRSFTSYMHQLLQTVPFVLFEDVDTHPLPELKKEVKRVIHKLLLQGSSKDAEDVENISAVAAAVAAADVSEGASATTKAEAKDQEIEPEALYEKHKKQIEAFVVHGFLFQAMSYVFPKITKLSKWEIKVMTRVMQDVTNALTFHNDHELFDKNVVFSGAYHNDYFNGYLTGYIQGYMYPGIKHKALTPLESKNAYQVGHRAGYLIGQQRLDEDKVAARCGDVPATDKTFNPVFWLNDSNVHKSLAHADFLNFQADKLSISFMNQSRPSRMLADREREKLIAEAAASSSDVEALSPLSPRTQFRRYSDILTEKPDDLLRMGRLVRRRSGSKSRTESDSSTTSTSSISGPGRI